MLKTKYNYICILLPLPSKLILVGLLITITCAYHTMAQYHVSTYRIVLRLQLQDSCALQGTALSTDAWLALR